MKALTIWQPWASLIMIGAKPYEWRRWRCPASLIGQRIVIHAGSRKVNRDELYDLIYSCRLELRQLAEGKRVTDPTAMNVEKALHYLERVWAGAEKPTIAAGLGTAVLGEPKIASELGFPCDSIRVEDQNWGWPMLDIEPFSEPLAMRGAQGFWIWPNASDALPELQLAMEMPS